MNVLHSTVAFNICTSQVNSASFHSCIYILAIMLSACFQFPGIHFLKLGLGSCQVTYSLIDQQKSNIPCTPPSNTFDHGYYICWINGVVYRNWLYIYCSEMCWPNPNEVSCLLWFSTRSKQAHLDKPQQKHTSGDLRVSVLCHLTA